jgi:hypothetical protein
VSRWRRRFGVTAVAVVAVLGAAKVVVELRDQVDPVDLDALAEDFAGSASATGEGGPEEPGTGTGGPEDLPVGLWSYAATGSEYIDILGGPLHEFPPLVAQGVTDTACGQSITVQLFEQRYDTLELCRDDQGALVLDRFETRHEFVGIVDVTVTEGCAPIRFWWKGIEADAGSEPTSVECTAVGDMSGEVGATVTREVVGVEPVEVDGAPLDAVRVRLTSTVGTPADPTHGTYDGEFWFGVDDGVILRRTLDARVEASTPLGNIGFEETFDIVATSTEPRAG